MCIRMHNICGTVCTWYIFCVPRLVKRPPLTLDNPPPPCNARAAAVPAPNNASSLYAQRFFISLPPPERPCRSQRQRRRWKPFVVPRPCHQRGPGCGHASKFGQAGFYLPRRPAVGRAVDAAVVSGGHRVDAGQRFSAGAHEFIHICL